MRVAEKKNVTSQFGFCGLIRGGWWGERPREPLVAWSGSRGRSPHHRTLGATSEID